MNVELFLKNINIDFFAGVPDSQLKPLCDILTFKYGTDGKKHIIAANEGNAVGLAAGYHLATGKIPAVYLQNSGIGNIINPVCSLLNKEVYEIPCVFIIGWRGEPGIKDEPQHVFQGKTTCQLLESIGIKYFVLEKNTSEADIKKIMTDFKRSLSNGEQVAFLVKKGALQYDGDLRSLNNNGNLRREEVIKRIVGAAGNGVIISTTGKTSRELYEIREMNGQGHENDFLTVGSMGHCSSIALSIAVADPQKKVWIIDGDGSVLMHMGSMAVMGSCHPNNVIHIVINNGSHESVGGQPTVASDIDLLKIAEGCGYDKTFSVHDYCELDYCLSKTDEKGLFFIEIKSALGSRDDLGRPKISPKEIKNIFMDNLRDDYS